MPLNGERQAPVETGPCRAFVFAKLRNHSLLTLLNDEEARAEPNQQDHGSNQACANTGILHIRLETPT